jgi:hypothetical protein
MEAEKCTYSMQVCNWMVEYLVENVFNKVADKKLAKFLKPFAVRGSTVQIGGNL